MGSTGAGAVTANQVPASRARSMLVPVNAIAGCTASGIARVARLMARVIADEAAQGRIQAEALVLRGDEGCDLGLRVTSAGGSRPRFVAAVHRAALAGGYFVYDPDPVTVTWSAAERARGQFWGVKTVESFHTYGTPDVANEKETMTT